MPRLSQRDQLKRYAGQIELAKHWRKDQGYDDLWERMIDVYRNKCYDEAYSDEDRIAINLAFSTINVIFPSVSVNTPKIGVLPNKPADEDRAVLVEAILNYYWKHYNFQTPFREAAKDFLILGHGWVKVGWKFVEGDEELGEDELTAQFAEQAQQLDAYAAEHPDEAGMLPSDDDLWQALVKSATVTLEDRPFVERVSPFDIFVDPEATNEYNMKWIAQRIFMPLEDVQKNKAYKASARKNVKATSAIGATQLSKDLRKGLGDDVKRVCVWEYYDLVTGTVCVWSEDSDEYLVSPQPVPFYYGHPFEMCANYTVPEFFYPIGELEMIEPLGQELNKTRSAMMNNRKAYARKYMVRDSAIDATGRQALESDVDGTVIPIGTDIPFSDVIAPVPMNPLSPDMYNWSEIIQGDINTVSGVNEYARGEGPNIRRTATEANLIQDATNARSADKLAIIEGFITRISRKLLAVTQQFLTGEQLARVVGKDQAIIWVPFTRDDVIGEYDFTVEAGSTMPLNENQRRQNALQLAAAMQPFLAVPGMVNMPELAKHILREGFGVRNPDKFITALPPMGIDPATGQPVQPAGEGGPPGAGGPPAPSTPGGAPSAQGPVGVGAPQPSPEQLLQAQQGAV